MKIYSVTKLNVVKGAIDFLTGEKYYRWKFHTDNGIKICAFTKSDVEDFKIKFAEPNLTITQLSKLQRV